MVSRWVGGVLGACVLWGCGSSGSPPSGGSAGTSLSGGGSAGQSSGGASSAGGPSGGAGGTVAEGGAEAIDLDATCRDRSSNHIPGTRIVYRTLVTPEGDKAYNGFYDKQLGIACRVASGKDGKDRCYPLNITSSVRDDLFTDEGCADAVYPISGSCEPPSLLSVYTPAEEECMAGSTTLYAIGSTYPAGSPLFLKDSSGNCGPAPMESIPQGYELVHRGAEVDPSIYAETPTSARAGAGRIGRRIATGADGSLLVLGYFDSKLKASCDFLTLQSGKEACLARSSLNYSAGFTDESCTVELMSASTRCGDPPILYTSQTTYGACGASVSREIVAGAPFTGTVHQSMGPAMCSPVLDPAPDTQYFLKTDVPDSEMPAVERSVYEGDPGRLKPVYRTSADGGCFFDDWWDSQLEVPCSFSKVGDSYRCLPVESNGTVPGRNVVAFKDSGCTQAVSLRELPSDCVATQIPKYWSEWDDSSACDRQVLSVQHAGAVYDVKATPLWSGSPSLCTPYDVTGRTFVELAEPLELSSFMEGTEAPL